ncbi:hypothetical protein Y032_0002g1001 [Ancylostoma ceylanicum]|uniref:Uncharacterized protein n=1 Tax=Ancylostoma ceylanicum TaxID=53326 RepID=A0A016VZ81_9BILA|nr:hypothetical protein Y032_0002g1001 [Ancylostoma ceylanicum]
MQQKGGSRLAPQLQGPLLDRGSASGQQLAMLLLRASSRHLHPFEEARPRACLFAVGIVATLEVVLGE